MPLIEVSVGELFDKICILNIKLSNVTDDKKRFYIMEELNVLNDVALQFNQKAIDSLLNELFNINSKLWTIEDRLRKLEREKRFDDEFIQLARGVYITNDRRAEIKSIINRKLNSRLVEQKEYINY